MGVDREAGAALSALRLGHLWRGRIDPDADPRDGIPHLATQVPGDCHVHVCMGGMDTDQVDDLILGCLTPLGDQGANIAKTSAIAAGLPEFLARRLLTGW